MENYPNVLRKRALIARNLAESANKGDNLQDLYCFGYQCQLFRDDERATFIDQGKHLIPWMDDDRLMIDRYDGRGYLHDLADYDAELCRSSFPPLTVEEGHIEALCDEERYLELNTDFLEKRLYEEEELKRLNEALASDGAYTAVGFSYDGNSANNGDAETENNTAEEDEDSRPYVNIPDLQLPASIKPPLTAKLHAIIERTAIFIAQHGVQMEIMMKTKQKDNPQFCFLNYEDELNAYYKHLVNAIKHKKYIPASMALRSTESESKSEHEYLHPSLVPSSAVDSKPEEDYNISSQEFLQSISSKLPAGQIANTPYAKLLSNLSRHTRNASPKPPEAVNDGTSGKESSLPSIKSAPSSLQNLGSTQQSAGYVYRGITQPPVPGLEPVSLPTTSTIGSAADSDQADLEMMHGPAIIPPTPDLQPIIDKMADYVARNGPEFEIVVRRRNDTRFHFIDPDHPHYAYYTHKKNLFILELARKNAEEERERVEMERREREVAEEELRRHLAMQRTTKTKPAVPNKTDDNLQIKGVSFSIKTKDEEPPMLSATALPYESSEEEEDDDDESDNSLSNQSGLPFTSTTAVAARTMVSQQHLPIAAATVAVVKPAGGSSSKLATTASVENANSHSMGLIPLPPEPTKNDRLADKLAAAARGRQLQAQRKSRAAAFMTLVKKTDTPAPPAADKTIGRVREFVSTFSTPGSAAEIPPSPLSIPSDRSRSSTPAASTVLVASRSVSPVVMATAKKSSPAPTPFIEKFLQSTASARASPLAMHPPTLLAAIAMTTKRRRHKSKSPRRHKHKSRSRSRSPRSHRKHKSRSRSPSKKHKKREKKLPSAYAIKRSVSPSPRHKPSEARSPSRSKRGAAGDVASSKQTTSSSSSARTKSLSLKRHHRRSEDGERLHRLSKRRRTKRSRRSRSRSCSASSLSSSSSHSLARRRIRRISDNLIDLTLNDQASESASSISSESNSPAVYDKSCGNSAHLSEVEALLKAKRAELLKEEIVILD